MTRFLFVLSLLICLLLHVVQPVRRCMYWKDSKALKVGCADLPILTSTEINKKVDDNYFANNNITIKMYYTNQRILPSIDTLCPACALGNELFVFVRNVDYQMSYDGVNIKVGTLISKQDKKCFKCLLSLFV
jgi:hypothetical protein